MPTHNKHKNKTDYSLTREERIAALSYDYPTQQETWSDACNLCGADDWVILTHHDRYSFPVQAVACRRCSLTVLNPRMSARGYSHFYQDVYRPLVSAYHGRRIDAQTIKSEQSAYAGEMERLLAPYLSGKSDMSFLDIGGSTGVVAAHFARRFGLAPTVLDPAPDEIEEAAALGLETITGLLEEWQPEGRRFDLVGMFQTIDHLLDVAGALRKLRGIIKDDGLFIVDVVDFRAAYLKNWSVEQAVKIDHPFSLTEATAEAYLARAGFAPIRRAYSADHHLVAYVCRPCEPEPDALPTQSGVEYFFRELRFVQNASRSKGGAL